MTTSALNHRYPAIQGELELEAEFEDEYELEAEFEEEYEDFGAVAPGPGGHLEAELEVEFDFETEAEAEYEVEFEDEAEDEAFVNPVRRIYRDAELMAHLSARAAQTESEEEAEAFIGALVPLAARLIPRAGRILARNAPALIRGVGQMTRQLRATPATRRLLLAAPVIVQRTAQSLADQAADGRPITADTALRTLTTMAGRVLRQNAGRQRAIDAVRVFERRYHDRWNAAPRRPAPRPGPAPRRRVGPSQPVVHRGRRRR